MKVKMNLQFLYLNLENVDNNGSETRNIEDNSALQLEPLINENLETVTTDIVSPGFEFKSDCFQEYHQKITKLRGSIWRYTRPLNLLDAYSYLSENLLSRQLKNCEIINSNWMVYSPTEESVFCVPCMFFTGKTRKCIYNWLL